jgi:hypothetical protein
MSRTHEGLKIHGSKNMDHVRGNLGVGVDGESESEEFEENIEIMGKAPKEPSLELNHSMFDEES